MRKNKTVVFVAILALTTLLVAVIPYNTVSYERTLTEAKTSELEPLPSLPYGIPHGLDPKTEQILKDLIHCESRGKATAINKMDRDGTPSYGLLQFKPDTLYGVVTQYGILPDIERDEIMNVIFDGRIQIKAFLAYYVDGQPISWWKQQFPACSKLYNYWQ